MEIQEERQKGPQKSGYKIIRILERTRKNHDVGWKPASCAR